MSPNSYIQFSASVTLDSNNDSCVLSGTPCDGNDNGNIFCTEAGNVANADISEEEEAAFSQYFWPGEASAPATCYKNGSCDYLVAPDCTAATTPPDDLISDINGGDYRSIALNGVTWRTLAGCIRYVVTGSVYNFKTPWICSPGLAFFISFSGKSAPYACTYNPSF